MAKIYYFLGHEQFHPEKLVEFARTAETAGFDGLFVSEHFNPWVDDKGASGFAFSTLGAIAAVTQRIELMTGVITPLFRYHPAVIAQAAATLDRISGGRFYLGVGTGESINETPLGIEFPKYTERSERMIEALKIMRRLLDKEKLSFAGNYYKTENVKLYSPPLHSIPILMAAQGPKSAELAAEYSDGIIVSIKDPREQNEKVIVPANKKRKLLGKAKLTIVTNRWTVFAKNEEQALKALAPWRGLRSPGRDTAYDPKLLQEEADLLNKNEILSKYTVLTSAEDYIDAYSPLITQLNSDIVVIQTTTHENQDELIRMIGKQVLTKLKRL